jgi:hypothetical protein
MSQMSSISSPSGAALALARFEHAGTPCIFFGLKYCRKAEDDKAIAAILDALESSESLHARVQDAGQQITLYTVKLNIAGRSITAVFDESRHHFYLQVAAESEAALRKALEQAKARRDPAAVGSSTSSASSSSAVVSAAAAAALAAQAVSAAPAPITQGKTSEALTSSRGEAMVLAGKKRARSAAGAGAGGAAKIERMQTRNYVILEDDPKEQDGEDEEDGATEDNSRFERGRRGRLPQTKKEKMKPAIWLTTASDALRRLPLLRLPPKALQPRIMVGLEGKQ